jgi:hypothetical protein
VSERAEVWGVILLGALIVYLRVSVKMTGSWRDLASRFPDRQIDGTVIEATRVAIGEAGTIARVTVGSSGIRIEPRWLPAWVLPPVAIQWEAVAKVQRQWLLCFPIRTVVLAGVPGTTLYMTRRVWRFAAQFVSTVGVEYLSPAANVRRILAELRAQYQ